MRVLLVEDDAGVRAFLCRAISHFLPCAEIVAVANGRLALDAFVANPASLVISDNRMPEISGLELLQLLRGRSAVPFIMLSADQSIERRALAAGASAFLGKPVSIGDLRAAIHSTLPAAIGYTEPCVK